MRGVTSGYSFIAVSNGFLLTRLMRGVTPLADWVLFAVSFLLTRLMRGVTYVFVYVLQTGEISTHTPHARRDYQVNVPLNHIKNFYSHASCEA